MQHRTAFFYADDGMVASTDLVGPQGEFDILTRLFNRVGIWNFFRKMAGMICRPCGALETQSQGVYKCWMMGEVLTYQDIQRVRVQYPDFGEDLMARFLVVL